MNSETTFDLIATCGFGLEAILRRELQALGLEAAVGEPGRVNFCGDLAAVVQTNLWLRTSDRVLIRVAEFPAPDFDALFETVRDLPWGQWLPADGCFPVTGRSIKSQLSSVPAIQRSVKRAIVDAMQRDHQTMSLEETGALYKVDAALVKDHATITIDTTGRSLHRRGYHSTVAGGPVKETLAAALVMLSYWRADRPLLDPFCASGTIPIEAARIGRNIAPGILRDFAYQEWTGVDSDLWQDTISQANAAVIPELGERILASDSDPKVVRAARENAAIAGVDKDIHFDVKPVSGVSSKRRFGSLITHLPSPRATGPDRELDELYRSLPGILAHFPTWSHYFLTSHPKFEAIVGRQADRRRKLYNGRDQCTYFQFHGPKPVVGEGKPASEPAVQPAVDTDQVPSEADVVSDEQSLQRAEKPVAKPYVHAVGQAAFGALTDKAMEQAELFAVRLRKRQKHLRRWPTKRGITCFRLYERDIPEIPLVVDRYEDHLHITEYERPHDRDPAQHENWLELMARTAGEALEIPKGNVFLKRRSRLRDNTQYEKIDQTNHRLEVHEGGLKFLVNLADYVDTGLFLDHRVTRGMVRELAEGKNFLNLFAYTGSFSVYAAAGGAKRTTTVDLSRNYLKWAEDNLKRNGFSGDAHRLVASDIETFINEHPPGEMYDLVVLDPPTYSRSKRTEKDWDVQREAVPLLQSLLPLVRKGGVIFFSCNFRRFKFDTEALAVGEIHEISKQTVPEDFRNRRIHRCWRIVK
ncbi:bifunctional 23S rRNA (guanine(2069)-N(7))-methyltransferase RlmK/23S rRNA (guanine(2445)-N(2))-methyltransferase RlmL [Stieleria varia]|uniref:Ribosomal RNA large subunit methyltransferase K/L n=1 Tax=Stieleria varia TaxID=2528005 RepID=A0A5C6AMX5_9BACT|nr:bifunctional 23S rRNA (guanine(2069)-N(7))-methyltransferase RlmK/23S rRNA (guanine(2445)-N(2))-methyltransferase RlmL [Stieleria varia]TWU00868.1 Ribosomal RNA large subunit methyltransferase K/L [Stieleria varia]